MAYDKAIKNKKTRKFQNPIPTNLVGLKDLRGTFRRYRKSDSKLRKPQNPIPVNVLDLSIMDSKPSEALVIYWLGHTSLLMEMGGRRYLLDPVLSERASMVSSIGPKRMHPSPLSIGDIREIDAVILSHDHYDHMDYKTIKHLVKSDAIFYAPHGVGKILKKWGAKPGNVHELNWWDEIKDGENTIAATPARHFAGRGLTKRNTTLWCSYVIMNEHQRVYFGGDSGIMPQYVEIGEKYGPFDLTIMPIGAYDVAWHDMHLFPAEAVDAHIQLKGNKLLPVHWAAFDLSLHPRSEPMEQLVSSALEHGIELLTPKVGEKVIPRTFVSSRWWEE